MLAQCGHGPSSTGCPDCKGQPRWYFPAIVSLTSSHFLRIIIKCKTCGRTGSVPTACRQCNVTSPPPEPLKNPYYEAYSSEELEELALERKRATTTQKKKKQKSDGKK
ncbi:hypothetical protein B0A52_00891 [Exophiala mesophila]|uniref:Uncharacterized protein n=1 Tax=Exophiala mesophila TaxID=212818 RepID=A0A438NII6_EXOME|nr:hypothetical protein B0A52_00891 [Exophiala mesophila]